MLKKQTGFGVLLVGYFLFFFFWLWNFLLNNGQVVVGTGGSSVFNFGKSTATLIEKEKSNITFDDVAGLEEAEMEVRR